MKSVVLGLLQIQALVSLAEWVLSPIESPRFMLIFVMLIFPLIMNIFQFWIVDSFIKAQKGYQEVDASISTLSSGSSSRIVVPEEDE
jgi:Na+/glutamate symporter